MDRPARPARPARAARRSTRTCPNPFRLPLSQFPAVLSGKSAYTIFNRDVHVSGNYGVGKSFNFMRHPSCGIAMPNTATMASLDWI